MLDMATNKYYYYIVTSQDVAQNKYVYNLSDFVAMGSTNEMFDEEEAANNYYNQEQNLIYENYIFHINFAKSNLQQDINGNSLLMELRDNRNETLIGVLSIQRDTIVYRVYNDKDAIINVSGTAIPETIYLGDQVDLDIETKFQQVIVDSRTVYDTKYFDQKLGIKISIYDINNNKLSLDSLFGINFELDGIKYYPRVDGTTRICIADKVTDVLAKIKINTEENSTIATGDYKIVIESFGSPDGIYYGLEASDKAEIDIRIINSAYGLKVTSSDISKIIDGETGTLEDGNNKILMQVGYESVLENPNITISLHRRKYDETYSQEYEVVDLKDYITTPLNLAHENSENKEKYQYEYEFSNSPTGSQNHYLMLKSNLVTGTYKVVYKLYDGENYVGEAYEYIIIK